MINRSLLAGLAALLATIQFCVAAEPLRLRPPAVPLVTHDPYFCIWSPADKLTDAATKHWTGKPQPLNSSIRIDGTDFRVIGNDPAGMPALPQTDVKVWPTRTICQFANSQIALTLTFTTPALPDDLDVLARPVTYIAWDVVATDGKPHAVRLDFGCGGELAVNTADQAVEWDRPAIKGFTVWRVGTKTQKILAKKGDDLRIDWGYAYLAVPNGQQPVAGAAGRVSLELGQVGKKRVSRHLLLAYDDLYSINYFGVRLRPYWRRHGMEPAALLQAAERDYPKLAKRCRAFDEQLMADLERAGGERYALLCALAYRQTLAGNKLAADANGKPLLFPKENFSNGCISTVDVLFPQAPFFLFFSPELTKAMLVPVLDYAASPRWPYPYAPHDLGTYPFATGQVYGMAGGDGGRMPVEECGNMLIILAALARQEGNASFAKPYWPMLTQWADYLVAEGLDPKTQLCSADMFGHLPRNANLALKAIIGIGGFAQLCDLAGQPDAARKYRDIARDYAAKWQELAKGDGHTLLAYGQAGTWSMKHNLVWDRVLGTTLIPDAIGDAEAAWYLKVRKPYGLPVDNRTPTCLIDWAMWSIALARDPKDFAALVEPIFRYASETPSRVPLSDWYNTQTGAMIGMQARPVVGGLYIKMIMDETVWAKRARQATVVKGKWAPSIIGAKGKLVETVPTARQQPVPWKYTLEKPADGWTRTDFDDTAWKSAPAGFGTAGTPGAIVRTDWHGQEIWLRREFNLKDGKLRNPRLLVHYDEDAAVWLNGVLAAELAGWTTAYEDFAIAPEALAALRPGKNVMTVHCQQTTGGQYIDAGLAELETTPATGKE